MPEIAGSNNRVLEIDLSRRVVATFTVSRADRSAYLGGKGLGLKYLDERLRPGVDPLGEDNYLAFFMGVLLGTRAPCSGRFAALTKSPLTGIMLSCSCGGPFGMAFKTAGYDGLLVTGRSVKPVCLMIDADRVTFEDAEPLWGLDTRAAQDALDLEKRDGALVIGPAGENGVLFANIASGHRFLGRGGMGAVMGAKRLKAVVARGGRYQMIPADRDRFARVCRRASGYIQANPFTSQAYRRFGTGAHVNSCNAGGILPVENFRKGRHADAGRVSGETMKEKYDSRPSTCRPCSILCGHRGTYPDGKTRQIPEYETIGMLGPNLGIFDADVISEWNDLCGRMGLDTISTGATLSYMMEAGEKGLLSTDLCFGSTDGVAAAIEDIAFRRDRGAEMAEGTRRLSEKYGGRDFAIQVKGLEMAAYDPRGSWGQGLAYAVANRGACHLSATLFPLEVFFGLLKPCTTRAKARFVCFFENLYAAVNSLHTCLFTSYAYVLEPPLVKYTPRPLLGLMMQYLPAAAVLLMDFSVFSRLFSAASGVRLSQWAFLKAGARIHTLERLMNTREGISRKDDTLPQRFLKEGRTFDPRQHTVPLEDLLDRYYRLRGYDDNGIPRTAMLKKLRLPASGPVRTDPRRKRFKILLVRVVLAVLGRALQSVSRRDRILRQEIAAWPPGFTVMFRVLPRGPQMAFEKTPTGSLAYRGRRVDEDAAGLTVFFKNIECAFLALTAQVGTAQGFVEHRMSLKGDIDAAMSLTRCLNLVQTYLYPKCIARRVVKRIPDVPLFQIFRRRCMLYLFGIPFGR